MATTTKKLYALANSLGLVENGNKEDPFHQLVYGLTGSKNKKRKASALSQ